MARKKKVRKIKHYTSNQTILLVGEGDFSFAACLAEAFGNASNMIATCLDSEDELVTRYSNAEDNIKVLEDMNCTILYEVDAHTMSKRRVLRRLRFDRIVFNFPHARLVPPYREHDRLQIKLHQEVVRGFFKSAHKLLDNNGEIHVTHKTAFPFDRWNIEELAEEAGLCLINEVPFDRSDYPGYINKKGEGHGIRCNKTFPVGACSTYMFGKS